MMEGIPVAVTGFSLFRHDEQVFLDNKVLMKLRRADDFTVMAVASASSAWDSAPERNLGPTETGLFVGTAFGPIETNFRFLDSLCDDGEGQGSPTLFSHSVHHAAAGYMARILDIQGPALTLTTFAWPFLTALKEALYALKQGIVRRALVVGVDVRSPLLEDGLKLMDSERESLGELGAVAWVLDGGREEVFSDHVRILSVSVTEKATDPAQFLLRSDEIAGIEGSYETVGKSPMGHAFSLTRKLSQLRDQACSGIKWNVKASFGYASVFFYL